jgi:hypothetical protein
MDNRMSDGRFLPRLKLFLLLFLLLPHESWAQFKAVRGLPGFWRIVQDEQGVWWFLSPEGKKEFLNTVTTVRPYQEAQNNQEPHYISKDWHGSLEETQGAIAPWAEKTVRRVYEAGFKGIGAWSHPALHDYDIPMTQVLNLWQWVGKKALLYDPQWTQVVEHAIQQQVVPLRDNRNLVGYYTDNELGFKDGFGHVNHYFNGLNPDNPNRKEVVNVIRLLWQDIESFNRDWQTHLKSWDMLRQWETLPEDPATTKARLASAWRYHLARDYFEITSALLKKYDPNHLNLGIRYKGHAPREVFRASKGLTDAQSINIYASDARLDPELIQAMYDECGAPIIISEYSFHAIDGKSGNKNMGGFIWGHVINQQARVSAYQIFMTRLASLPYMIGADWFQWNDEPPAGRSDGEDVNFGIVDIHDHLYESLVQAIQEMTPRLNRLHEKSLTTDHRDIWRSNYREVLFNIHHVQKGQINIDGHLDEWTDTYAIGDLQYVPNIGVENSDELKLPKVYFAWSDEGIYFAAQVLSKDVFSYPINEETINSLWRSRSFDGIEIWLSTLPVAKEQWWFDQHTHDFLFLPNKQQESGGTLIQWYYLGDRLDKYTISPAGARYKATYESDTYSVELFLPKSLLQGYSPKDGQEMAGNVFIRNWKPSIAYFWSAYESMYPQYWGQFKLVSP